MTIKTKVAKKTKTARNIKILAHIFAVIGVVFVLFIDLIVGLLIIGLAAIGYANAVKKGKQLTKSTS